MGSCERSTLAVETMQVITGDDEGACSEYVPGGWPEEANDEPADSMRATLIPDQPEASGERSVGHRLEQELARDTILAAIGVRPEEYRNLIAAAVELRLGRGMNEWEDRAVNAYLASVSIGLLLQVAQ